MKRTYRCPRAEGERKGGHPHFRAASGLTGQGAVEPTAWQIISVGCLGQACPQSWAGRKALLWGELKAPRESGVWSLHARPGAHIVQSGPAPWGTAWSQHVAEAEPSGRMPGTGTVCTAGATESKTAALPKQKKSLSPVMSLQRPLLTQPKLVLAAKEKCLQLRCHS